MGLMKGGMAMKMHRTITPKTTAEEGRGGSRKKTWEGRETR